MRSKTLTRTSRNKNFPDSFSFAAKTLLPENPLGPKGEGGRRPDEGEMMQHIQFFPLTLTLSLMERGLKTLLAAN